MKNNVEHSFDAVPQFALELILLTTTAGIATVMDIESTVQAQRDPEASEANSWLYGDRPGRLRMYATSIPVLLGFAQVACRLHRDYGQGRRWLWRFPLLALSAGHLAAAALNRRNFPALPREASI